MRYGFYGIIVLLFAFCTLHGQEYRAGVSLNYHLFPKLVVEGESELRTHFKTEPYFNTTFSAHFRYSFFDPLYLGIFYSYSIRSDVLTTKDYNDEIDDKYKFGFDIAYKSTRFNNDLRFNNRLRYQYTICENKSKQYIKNKLTLDYKITNKMNPYIAIEPYYSILYNEVNVIRFYIGNEMPLFISKLEFYYIAEIHFREEYFYKKYKSTQYIVGVSYKLKLK